MSLKKKQKIFQIKNSLNEKKLISFDLKRYFIYKIKHLNKKVRLIIKHSSWLQKIINKNESNQ